MIFHVLNETLSCSLILNLFLIKQRETVRIGNEELCLFWFWRLHKYAGRDITGYFFHLIWWSSSNHMLKYSTSLCTVDSWSRNTFFSRCCENVRKWVIKQHLQQWSSPFVVPQLPTSAASLYLLWYFSNFIYFGRGYNGYCLVWM